MDIENYPFINPEEFAEACHLLDSQYCRATLGPLRKRWKLKVCTALDLAFSTEGGYTTYIQIVRPLEIPGDLDLNLDSFTISPSPTTHDIPTADDKMIDDESDEVCGCYYWYVAVISYAHDYARPPSSNRHLKPQRP